MNKIELNEKIDKLVIEAYETNTSYADMVMAFTATTNAIIKNGFEYSRMIKYDDHHPETEQKEE